MSFSLAQLGLIVVGYLVTLFSAAYAVERGWVPRQWVRHPVVYILSLGVYASAWAFYGSVGLANDYGYGFLAYYLGISGAFVMSPVLLRPLLRIIRTYQLSSLADLLAFRYRSRFAGVIVTLLMIAVVIPMLTLQIRAVADTLHILNHDWHASSLAFGFCLVMIVFAVLFGARHVSPREKHEGLVFALAFESLLKLTAIITLSLVVLFGVFGEIGGLEQWLTDNQSQLANQQVRLQEGPWRTLLLVFFAAAVVMPHMFHIAFTENLSPQALRPASWGFPLFLLLMAMAVPPILWAGVYLQLDVPPEYFSLGIGIHLGSPALVVLTFLGGLAAASGIIIVITLSLAAMLMNHVLLPLYKPSPGNNFYQWLLWMRRSLIALILLLAYGFYLLVGANIDLSRLGLLAFVAAVQFLPGVLGLLYWPRSTQRGFVIGLLGGIVCWLYSLLLPLSKMSMGWSIPFPTPAVDENNWYLAALASIAVNVLLFLLFSLSHRQTPNEISAAEACSIDTLSRPNRQPLLATDSNDMILALSQSLGRYVAEREVHQALDDLELPSYENRPYALRQLRARLEANLSGLMGPTVAYNIITRSLPFRDDSEELGEDIYQMEQRLEDFQDRLGGLAGELDNLRRYHRQTLEHLPIGVCSLAHDGEILMWNQAMQSLTGVESQQVNGSYISHLPSPWQALLTDFMANNHLHEHKKRIDIDARPHWYSLHKALIHTRGGQPGGTVILMEDQTDSQLLEDQLVHSERLASIGRLAAGVAHEIGNPVTGIDSLAQLIRYETDNPELQDMANQIQEQTKRITRIVQSLMNFSHAGHHSTEHEAVAIFECVNDAIQLLKLSQRSQDIVFNNQCSPDLFAFGDAQRLVQVFVNLLGNARDASQPGQSIDITANTDEHKVDIHVTDQGQGIPSDKQGQIFEPFFTTKEVGKGTGLGLALVHSIIEEHYGQISIVSPVINGQGTCVTVSLPRYEQPDRTPSA